MPHPGRSSTTRPILLTGATTSASFNSTHWLCSEPPASLRVESCWRLVKKNSLLLQYRHLDPSFCRVDYIEYDRPVVSAGYMCEFGEREGRAFSQESIDAAFQDFEPMKVCG